MKISNLFLLAMLAVSVLVMPVSAANNNSTPDLMPSLKVGWNGLPASIQSWIFWIISLSFVGLVVVALIYTWPSGSNCEKNVELKSCLSVDALM